MNRKMWKTYKSDQRTTEDIEEQIRKLSLSYTPEWHCNIQDPDIGATIARIYARQMQDNIRSINNVTEIYHAAFINLLDLTLKRALPARSIVTFHLVDSSISGAQVPKGTQITTDDTPVPGMLPPVFETERDLYVTSSRLRDIFMTDREEGTVIPLLGEFLPPQLYTKNPVETPEAEEEEEEEKSAFSGGASGITPFILFGEKGGIGRHALAILHPRVFDVENESIYIRIDGNDRLPHMISSGELFFRWYGKDGELHAFSDMSIAEDGSYCLHKDGESGKINVSAEEEDSVVVLESAHPLTEVMEVNNILLSSEGGALAADYVGDGSTELSVDEFAPFSDTLSIFAECYIGKENCFEKAGSRVTMDFHLTFEEHILEVGREEEQVELKIIKKKTRAVRAEEAADAYADEITIEYFNGIGWKKLNCETEYRTLFAELNAGQFQLSFICPDDWGVSESGSYQGRLLRMRLLRSDNCYMRPGIHHYPVITGLKVSYTYVGREMRPAGLRSICGTFYRDLTADSRKGEAFNIFTPTEFADDALYLGFDKPMETGPIGLLFVIQGGLGQKGIQCQFEYSSRRGFRMMKVVDGTEDFTHSGIVMFLPPSDFAATTIEGKKRYWLRVVRNETQQDKENRKFMVHVEDILINSVMVANAVSLPEEDFYIEGAESGYRTYLGASNILDAEVWVNEKGSLSSDEMRRLAVEHPDDVKLDHDLVGNISSCFIRWRETEQFEEWDGRPGNSHEWDARRVYRIDRLTSEIIFGDGIHSDIPRVTDNVAFRIRLRTCAGEAGNLPAGSLNVLPENQIFIDSVVNPVKAYGGCNMETVPQALQRGADRIHSSNRCVSMNDYKRAILRFSTVIDKVACVPGMTVEGRENPAELSFVLLMKDYADGSFSFHRIMAPVKRYLLKQCEMTVPEERLHVVEPIFVEISVAVWLEVMDMDDSFDVQNNIMDTLKRYLDPVNGGGEDGEGWEIGTMPKKTQLLLQLNGLKNQALIRKTSITARYTDNDGEHETDFDDLKLRPFMVCKSGAHQVNIIFNKGEKDASD